MKKEAKGKKKVSPTLGHELEGRGEEEMQKEQPKTSKGNWESPVSNKGGCKVLQREWG